MSNSPQSPEPLLQALQAYQTLVAILQAQSPPTVHPSGIAAHSTVSSLPHQLLTSTNDGSSSISGAGIPADSRSPTPEGYLPPGAPWRPATPEPVDPASAVRKRENSEELESSRYKKVEKDRDVESNPWFPMTNAGSNPLVPATVSTGFNSAVYPAAEHEQTVESKVSFSMSNLGLKAAAPATPLAGSTATVSLTASTIQRSGRKADVPPAAPKAPAFMRQNREEAELKAVRNWKEYYEKKKPEMDWNRHEEVGDVVSWGDRIEMNPERAANLESGDDAQGMENRGPDQNPGMAADMSGWSGLGGGREPRKFGTKGAHREYMQRAAKRAAEASKAEKEGSVFHAGTGANAWDGKSALNREGREEDDSLSVVARRRAAKERAPLAPHAVSSPHRTSTSGSLNSTASSDIYEVVSKPKSIEKKQKGNGSTHLKASRKRSVQLLFPLPTPAPAQLPPPGFLPAHLQSQLPSLPESSAPRTIPGFAPIPSPTLNQPTNSPQFQMATPVALQSSKHNLDDRSSAHSPSPSYTARSHGPLPQQDPMYKDYRVTAKPAVFEQQREGFLERKKRRTERLQGSDSRNHETKHVVLGREPIVKKEEEEGWQTSVCPAGRGRKPVVKKEKEEEEWEKRLRAAEEGRWEPVV